MKDKPRIAIFEHFKCFVIPPSHPAPRRVAFHGNRLAPDGTRSHRPFDDFGGLHRARLEREGDEYLGRDAEVRGILRGAKLLASTVEPPGAKAMLPVDAKPAGTGQKLLSFMSTDFIVEIRKGMQFAYDVHVDPESVHDHVSLILLINTRDSR